MDQFGLFTDLPGISVEDDYGRREGTWAANAHYYHPWNASLATRLSDMYDTKMPVGIEPTHDMQRLERIFVQPNFPAYPSLALQSSAAELGMSNSFAFNKPYEAAFPDSYPRQGSPTETNSSRRSVCHSDDASTDRTARCSLSSNSDYSPAHLPYDYASLSAPCSQITPGGGSCIALSEIQQYPDESPVDSEEYETAEEMEPAATAYERDTIHCGAKIELQNHHHHDDIQPKEEPAAFDRAESEQADVKDEDEGSDQEYKPHRKSSTSKRPRRRSSQSSTGSNGRLNVKRQSRCRKGSLCSSDGRIKKSKGHKSKPSISDDTRPFPCPFAGYCCESTFTSKNEWKRHVSTQHIKLGFWRCDMCPPSSNASDPYNDFNRKDLFTQHLRRMHADAHTNGNKSPTSVKKGVSLTNAIPEEVVTEHQRRCYIRVRSMPPTSSCLFCNRNFAGEGSWLDRMDHVGSHFERDRKNSVNGTQVTDVDGWREDLVLRDWLQQEGLVGADEKGVWTIGDGVPLRQRGVVEE